MYRSYDRINGIEPRIYRSPAQIREDMLDICARISRANEMMNVRNIISEIVISAEDGEIRRQIDAVSELLLSAEKMLSELSDFENSLDMLSEELRESVAALS